MSDEHEDKKDRAVGPSSCCPDAELRYSEPCHARYCEGCDTWIDEPKVEAEHVGPSWQRGPDGRFIIPRLSLGPVLAAWVKKYVKGPDGSPQWRFTREQLRLLYWWYAIDERGRWVYREGTIQRLKGWGKDPFAALLALIELCGPCRPVVDPDTGLAVLDSAGNPVAKPQTAAWVQVMAVSKDQTKNTMRMFAVLASKRMKADYGVVVGKEQVVALAGERMIEAVTSAPATREGNRPTFQIGNEPHHWKENNEGHEMREVMDRNNKMPWSRILWITNAYNESQNSVGQVNREGYELDQPDDVMYDSLEAPTNARVLEREIPPVINAVRGDATWVNIEDITRRMMDSRNPVSVSRRFYYNQLGADDEAAFDPKDIDATIDPQVKAWRHDPEIDTSDKDVALRLGWAKLAPSDEMVLFGDGGKSDDHTTISGRRLSDGYTFAVGAWGRPPTLDKSIPWRAPRHEVEERIDYFMEHYAVVGVWFDPSHAKDDETDDAYWDGVCDSIHRKYKDRLQFWAVKTGDKQHSVRWDMSSPAHAEAFVEGVKRFTQELEDRTLIHDGNPRFVQYLRNARGYMTRYGLSIWKGARGSARKIDGAVTHIGALVLATHAQNREETEEQETKGGIVWW